MKLKDIPYADVAVGVIAFIGLVLTIFTISYDYSHGEGELFTPSSFAIIRNSNTSPSDLIVIPLEWRNNGGRHELVNNVSLYISKVNDISFGKRFYVAGEFFQYIRGSY